MEKFLRGRREKKRDRTFHSPFAISVWFFNVLFEKPYLCPHVIPRENQWNIFVVRIYLSGTFFALFDPFSSAKKDKEGRRNFDSAQRSPSPLKAKKKRGRQPRENAFFRSRRPRNFEHGALRSHDHVHVHNIGALPLSPNQT